MTAQPEHGGGCTLDEKPALAFVFMNGGHALADAVEDLLMQAWVKRGELGHVAVQLPTCNSAGRVGGVTDG